jgi:hypothetical protein
MNFSDISKPKIIVPDGWTVKWDEFYGIDPECVSLIVGTPFGYTCWDCFFLDTLLSIENASQELLLDVGWYPAKDPSGTYVASLLRRRHSPEAATHYDWDSPVRQLSSRDPIAILEFVEQVVSISKSAPSS